MTSRTSEAPGRDDINIKRWKNAQNLAHPQSFNNFAIPSKKSQQPAQQVKKLETRARKQHCTLALSHVTIPRQNYSRTPSIQSLVLLEVHQIFTLRQLAHLLCLIPWLVQLVRVEAEVPWLTARSLEHLDHRNRGYGFESANPQEDLGHGSRCHGGIVRSD